MLSTSPMRAWTISSFSSSFSSKKKKQKKSSCPYQYKSPSFPPSPLLRRTTSLHHHLGNHSFPSPISNLSSYHPKPQNPSTPSTSPPRSHISLEHQTRSAPHQRLSSMQRICIWPNKINFFWIFSAYTFSFFFSSSQMPPFLPYFLPSSPLSRLRRWEKRKGGKERRGGGVPEARRETYLEVERRGLVFGIKGGILTSLLEQSVQLFISFSFAKY